MDAAVAAELRIPLLRLGAEIVLGGMKPEVAVALASELLANGVESEAVLELATLPPDPNRLSVFEVEPLARRMLADLGVTIPSTGDAGWIMARFIAEAMISGAIEPPRGALRLWGLWRECGAEPGDELVEMLHLHDAWEASVGSERDAIEVEMLQCAPRVVAAADRRLAPNEDA
jgi:hypothetical protein